MFEERESAAGLLSLFYWLLELLSLSPVTWTETAVWGITRSSECSSAGALTGLLSLPDCFVLEFEFGPKKKKAWKNLICMLHQFICGNINWKSPPSSLQALPGNWEFIWFSCMTACMYGAAWGMSKCARATYWTQYCCVWVCDLVNVACAVKLFECLVLHQCSPLAISMWKGSITVMTQRELLSACAKLGGNLHYR